MTDEEKQELLRQLRAQQNPIDSLVNRDPGEAASNPLQLNLSDQDKQAVGDYATNGVDYDKQARIAALQKGQQKSAEDFQALLNGTFRDTGRVASSPGEYLDSVIGAPARTAIDQMQKGDFDIDPIGQMGKDPHNAPSTVDLAWNTGIRNPYLGAAAATGLDLSAQLPVGMLGKLGKLSEVVPMAGKLEDVSKTKVPYKLSKVENELHLKSPAGEADAQIADQDSLQHLLDTNMTGEEIDHGLSYNNPLYINSLHVNPEYQGQGYGSKILSLLENKAKAQGADGIVLNAQPMSFYGNEADTNKLSDLVKFYEKNGFTPFKDEGSNVLMHKSLSEGVPTKRFGSLKKIIGAEPEVVAPEGLKPLPKGYSMSGESSADPSMYTVGIKDPDGNPAGFVKFKIDNQNKTISPIYQNVSPEHQGQGLATNAYQYMLDQTKNWYKSPKYKLISAPEENLTPDGKAAWNSWERRTSTGDTPSSAQSLIDSIKTPEQAAALSGEERQAYLNALDQVYGLKEQRIRDMGFDPETYYHGTTKDFSSFSPDARGTGTNAPSAKKGYFFSQTPETAEQYATALNSDPKGALDYSKEYSQKFGKFPDYHELNDYISKASGGKEVIYPVKLKMGDSLEKDFGGSRYREQSYSKLMDEAKNQNKDSVLFKNTMDPGEALIYPKAENIAAVFNPNQIRSENAAFDPRFKDSTHLLAGQLGPSNLTGANLVAPAASNDQLQPDLEKIAMIESSGGKNKHHEMTHAGLNKGQRAGGSTGLMPIMFKETLQKNPELAEKYPDLLHAPHKKITAAINDNPGMEAEVANAHWDRLEKIFGGDKARMAYAWRNGITAAKKASDVEVQEHPYVQKFMNGNQQGKLARFGRLKGMLGN